MKIYIEFSVNYAGAAEKLHFFVWSLIYSHASFIFSFFLFGPIKITGRDQWKSVSSNGSTPTPSGVNGAVQLFLRLPNLLVLLVPASSFPSFSNHTRGFERIIRWKLEKRKGFIFLLIRRDENSFVLINGWRIYGIKVVVLRKSINRVRMCAKVLREEKKKRQIAM